MALGPLHTEINSISVSTKSKGTSSEESTYQTDVRWRHAAMRREGLRAESKHITPRSVKTREALLWSKGLGVGNWQTKTFLSLGIMMVPFPGLNWHRRAKVPLHQKVSCNCYKRYPCHFPLVIHLVDKFLIRCKAANLRSIEDTSLDFVKRKFRKSRNYMLKTLIITIQCLHKLLDQA